MKKFALPLITVLLLLLPFWSGGDYYTNLGSKVLIAAILASSLNLLVGYAGLTSLGHAAYLGMAAYSASWLMLHLHVGHLAAAVAALLLTTLMGAVFGLIALRASGLGFLMITLALGQILWGVAYRWANVTGGDNGLSGLTRPAPFGIDLSSASHFYYFTLVIFAVVLGLIAVLMRAPFGASIRGTRDQPRRMNALGYNVRLIRWLTFVISAFLGAVGGLMDVYYEQFISPHALALAHSAEILLMVISGGAGTLSGPVIGAALVVLLKNLASAYIERWTMLLGFVFVLIVLFIPDGLVVGLERGCCRLAAWLKRKKTVAGPPASPAQVEGTE